LVTLRVKVVEGGGAAVLNVAVTFWGWLIVSTQVSVPEQAPLHPVKVEAGVALNAMVVPPVKFALHDAPQSIPPGLEATLPLPTVDTASV
jgi:hypothetical protein